MTNPLDGHPLPEQFEALPIQLQSRLFGLTDILRSMDPTQAEQTQQALTALAMNELFDERPFVRALLTRMAGLVMWSGVLDEQSTFDDAVERLAREGEFHG